MRELSCMNLESKDLYSVVKTVPVRLIAAQVSEHSAPWFFRGAEGMASFYVVLAGKCRLKFHEGEAGIPLGAGDLAVVLRGENHWLQSCRNESGIHAGDTPQKAKILQGRFAWDQKKLVHLLPHLSPVVCFRSEGGCIVSWMKKGIRMIAEETDASGPGVRAAIDHIAHTIFVRSVQMPQIQGDPAPKAPWSAAACCRL